MTPKGNNIFLAQSGSSYDEVRFEQFDRRCEQSRLLFLSLYSIGNSANFCRKMSKTYTAAEVSKHNHVTDLWIVYKDGVYDITKFLKEHPGGQEVLLDLAGRDATEFFDDIGHTEEAIHLRESYKIGTLVGSISEKTDATTGVQRTTIDDDNWQYNPPAHGRSPWFAMFIAGIVGIYAFIFYTFCFSSG